MGDVDGVSVGDDARGCGGVERWCERNAAGMRAQARRISDHQKLWPKALARIGASCARALAGTFWAAASPVLPGIGGRCSVSWWVSAPDRSAMPIEPPTRWTMFRPEVARATWDRFRVL